MTLTFIGLCVLVAGLALFFLKKPAKPSKPPKSVARTVSPQEAQAKPDAAPSRPSAAVAEPSPASPAAPGLPAEMPPELAAFEFVRHEALSAERKKAIVAVLSRMPRPPPSLHKLISPRFMAQASSAELSAVVMSEPGIAAKVLVTVNSPFYGLSQPVASMGQAVTFLGFNTVRSIGLKYILNDSFKAGSAELNSVFDKLWASSALAGDLCTKLSHKLDLPDQGALVTHLMLSFIGQLATRSLMPAHLAVSTAQLGFLQRAQAEQAQLGLASAEIGSLLMQEWGLPPSIIEEVRAIDRVLVTPASALDAARGTRLALSFLCARLGERLAHGSLDELAAFDVGAGQDPDFFHLQSYLGAPALARLPECLRAPDLQALVAHRQEAAALGRGVPAA